MKTQLPTLVILLLSFLGLQAQIVEIPDPALKFALVNEMVVDLDFDGIYDVKVDTNNDGEIQQSEALAVQSLGVIGRAIANMQGIEAFENLTSLVVSYNDYTTIDVSTMADLEVLIVAFSELTELDVTQNPNLIRLDFDFNSIESVDLSNNPQLERLWGTFNLLTEIDLTANPNLLNVNLDSNSIESIDLSANTVLDRFAMDNNLLTEIDFSSNTNLTFVDVYNNGIESLDLSFQDQLTFLTCLNNDLNYLNIQNGNNAQLEVFNATNNPDLSCIQVDDVSLAQDQDSWQFDEDIQFSEDCLFLSTSDLDAIEWALTPNPAKDLVWIQSTGEDRPLANIRVTDINGRLFFSTDNSIDRIDLAGWPAGLYFVAATNLDGRQAVSKLLKQ